MHTSTKLDADQSALFLADKLTNEEPFLFIRYGDGALECINSLDRGQTCDGEKYSPELTAGLLWAWEQCADHPNVYVGDWLSASFDNRGTNRYAAEYAALVGKHKPKFLHFECLLLMRRSQALLDFYRAVKADKRRKCYLGPESHRMAAQALGCSVHIETPMKDLYRHNDSYAERLLAIGFDVLLYGAGMAGNIPVVQTWQKYPERTYINLGSALDPISRGRTRIGQLSEPDARAFLLGVI